MASPANYNRYKEISRPNVNKIVKLGLAFRGTHIRSSWCVWEREREWGRRRGGEGRERRAGEGGSEREKRDGEGGESGRMMVRR